ncbi:hypothetical protein [Oscillatoria sp. HE19RPO]|nr:hypothetical protein [Oscillatoria sp. HE19RPO]
MSTQVAFADRQWRSPPTARNGLVQRKKPLGAIGPEITQPAITDC